MSARLRDMEEGRSLKGVVLKIPPDFRAYLPEGRAEMALRSFWMMGEGRRGLWLAVPGEAGGQVYPAFDVPVEDLFEWEVVA